MARVALEAWQAARAAAQRGEEERLEEEWKRQEGMEKLELEVKEFEEDLRRFKEGEEEQKQRGDGRIGQEQRNPININAVKGKPSSNDKSALPPLPTTDPPSLTIRNTEAAYRAIEAQDLSYAEVDMPGIEIGKTEYIQRTTKRALETEIAEAGKRKRRHLDLLERYDEGFDGAYLVQGRWLGNRL